MVAHLKILANAALVTFGLWGNAQATLINGDFETGDLTGWTTFTTVNGALGMGAANVVPFDTSNDGTPSDSAHFRVGGNTSWVLGDPAAGGGIYQSVMLGAGTLSISADIASHDQGLGPVTSPGNGAGGLFELLLDGVVVDSFDFGNMGSGETKFAVLTANLSSVLAGSHEIEFLMTRTARVGGTTPEQYIDTVVISGTAVAGIPEPGSLSIVLLGIGLVGWHLRRNEVFQSYTLPA